MLTYPLPRALLAAGVVAALGGAGLAFALQGAELSPLLLVGCFLIAFGSFKGALAIDALLTLRRNAERAQALAAMHGSAGSLRAWIAYKLIAMAVALLGAGVCIVVGL